jgi:zinc transport system substrate-binding protein
MKSSIARAGTIAAAVCMVALLFAGAGCQRKDQGAADRKLRVVATLFPLYDFAGNVGGDRAEVTLLLPPGVEAHSYEPKPGDVVRATTADVFIFTGKFMEPWAEGFLKGVNQPGLVVIDASRGIALVDVKGEDHELGKNDAGHGHGHSTVDPHIWLDFANARKMVDTIAEGFAAKDPPNRELYLKNAALYNAKLVDLDREYRETLAACQKKVIIHGGHFAFGYLARRYGLTYEAAYGGSPDAEPTARRLVEMKNKLKQYGVDYVYYEELITPRVADVLARETGAKLLKLHGVHNISKEDMNQGVTYLQLMAQNLTNLKTGLQCQ